MRVLVTGGAGFIGSHVVDALLGEGHSVAVVDDLSAGISENIDRRAHFYRASITDTESLKRVFAEERPQIVNHHSAQTDVRASMADPLSDARVNILGTVNLLQLSVEHDVNRFMFASTCAVYFEPSYMPMDESHPVKPQSGYGMSKHAAEGYITLYGDTYGPELQDISVRQRLWAEAEPQRRGRRRGDLRGTASDGGTVHDLRGREKDAGTTSTSVISPEPISWPWSHREISMYSISRPGARSPTMRYSRRSGMPWVRPLAQYTPRNAPARLSE